jgi:hypothetical protein
VRSIAKPIFVGAGLFFALCAAAVLCLNIYLQSNGVQLKLRQAASRITGFEPVISQTYYTPWSGLTVSGIKIPQADNSKKPLLAMRSVKCRVSLTALLQGRILIKDVTFEQPSLLIVQGQSGVWPIGSALPFQDLDKKPAGSRQPLRDTNSAKAPAFDTTPHSHQDSTPVLSAAEPEEKSPKRAMRQIVENIRIHEGQAFFYPAQGRPIRLEGFEAEGKVSPDGSTLGVFRIKTAAFTDLLRCTDITGNFQYLDGQLQIQDMKGAWAQGTLKGNLEISKTPAPFFNGALVAENVSLQKLAEEAGFSAEGTQGSLFAKTRLQGIPGRPESFAGEASASLTEARMQPIDPLRQLGELLRINELRVLELRNAQMALTIRDGKILVNSLELESSNLLVDATGEAGLNGSLNLDARFHVTQKLLQDSLGFMGSKFQASDRVGYAQMPFSITGNMTRPKSDLLDKLVGVRLGDDVSGLLKNLLRIPKKEKKKKKDTQPAATPAPTN